MKILAIILMMASPVYAGQLSSNIPGMALLSHLNEGTGVVLTNSVTGGAAAQNSGVWVNGRQGKGLNFQTNQYATLQNVDIGGTALSFGVWAKFTGTAPQTWQAPFSKWQGDNNGSGFRILAQSTTTAYTYIAPSIGASGFTGCDYGWYAGTKGLPSSSSWLFLVGTFTAGKFYFYVNGVEICKNLSAKATVTNPTTSEVSLGRMQWTIPANMFCGNCTVDEPFIVKRFLTAGEVQKLYIEQLGKHGE